MLQCAAFRGPFHRRRGTNDSLARCCVPHPDVHRVRSCSKRRHFRNRRRRVGRRCAGCDRSADGRSAAGVDDDGTGRRVPVFRPRERHVPTDGVAERILDRDPKRHRRRHARIVAVPAITLTLANLSETVVVSATKVESQLVDAPATMSVLTSQELASSPAQNYGDLLRTVPGLNVDSAVGARHQHHEPPGDHRRSRTRSSCCSTAASIYLDFFGIVLWDFAADEPERHQADRSHSRSGVGGLGRQRADRRRQHHHEVAARGAGHGGDVHAAASSSRDAGSSAGQGAGGLFGANAHVRGRAQRHVVVPRVGGLLQLRRVSAADRSRFRSSPIRAIPSADRRRRGVSGRRRRCRSARRSRTAAPASRSSTRASIRSSRTADG